jgi:hypothetical protein
MADDIFIINPSVGVRNGEVVCLPQPGQVGMAGDTNQGSGGFVLSYPVPEPERVQVTDADTAEGGAAGRYFQSEELRRERHGESTTSQFTVDGTATELLPAQPGRIKALIINNGTDILYLGHDSSVTSSNGIPLASGANYEDDVSESAWYAISAGSSDVRVEVVL